MNAVCLAVILPGFILIFASSTMNNIDLNTTRLSSRTAKTVVIINGTHVEVTTVKIAEIYNHTKTTTILKAITAKHFTSTTPMASTEKVILIPPANHTAQIKGHHKEKNV